MRWNIRLFAGATLLAAALTLFSPNAARADCSVDDLFNGLESTVGAVFSGACAGACSDGAGCGAAVAVVAVLVGVATEAGNEGPVNQFCSALKDTIDGVNSGSDDASTVIGLLKNVDASLSQALQQALASALSDVTSVLGAAECGCLLHQGLGQLDNFVSSCVQDVLCDIGDLVDEPCHCTPVPALQGNCTEDAYYFVQYCRSHYLSDPAGCAYDPNHPVIIDGNTAGSMQPNQRTGPDGSWVVWIGGDTSDGQYCSPVVSCYCPAPMKPIWEAVSKYDSVFVCHCPDGSHDGGVPIGSDPTAACLCDGTNQPINLKNPFGMCAQPWGCAPGLISIGDKCVKPCADPTQGMTFDGTCCNPAQVTACGECCPAGTTPDPSSGACIPPTVLK
jgi:hypothetical protein